MTTMRERIAKTLMAHWLPEYDFDRSPTQKMKDDFLRAADAVLAELEQPSDAMVEAIADDETPFIRRRKADKSGYEVMELKNDDWREVISNDMERVGNFATHAESDEFYSRCVARYKFIAAIKVAKGEIE